MNATGEKQLKLDSDDFWQNEYTYFFLLAILGTATSYLSVKIPYTDVFIEGRWIFGYIGFVLLPHWWTALLLACTLSVTHVSPLPLWTIFTGNMLYAFPSFLVIRFIHTHVLNRLRSLTWYGAAWMLMILLCYQLFTTPAIWGFLAVLENNAIWPSILAGWRAQPFLIESLLVGIISALAVMVIRSNTTLRASRQELSTTLYSIGDGVIATDTEGRIQHMNPTAERLTGWSETEAVGKPLETVFHILNEETKKPVALPLDRVLKEGTVVGLANHTLLVAQDGIERPILDSIAPIQGKDGLVSGVVLVFQDQTGERALQKIMTQVLATVPAGILLLDANHRILQANPVAEEYLAVLAQAKAGDRLSYLGDRPLSELLTPPLTKGLWHEIKINAHTFEAIAEPMGPIPTATADGRWLNRDSLEPEQWVLVINNVTQEREIQTQLQQQERLAAVGQLAAGIAHDFNNIMAVITLYTQIELNKDLPNETHKRLKIISQQIKEATTLIQQILDFSRRAVLKRRPMDLAPFLNNVVKLLERTVPENITIDLHCGTGKYTVNADPTRLQQAILNLVVNARDAMPEGGELHITLSRTTKTDEIRCVTCDPMTEGNWVCVAVTDTGNGIPPKILPHIFEPFFTTKEVGKGVGLGLAQVYGIVKQHKGHINVTTKEEVGTTFLIYLPVLLADQPEVLDTETQAVTPGQRETILIVEDNTALRQALMDGVTALNYQVLEAANGQEALDILELHPKEVSLVLSDLVMPEMGGQALFHAMRHRDLKIPVVILSGHPMKTALESMKEEGLAGWMLKPPDMKKLSQLVASTLREAPEHK